MKYTILTLLLLVASGAFAWEDTLSRLGITRKQVESEIESALAQGSGMIVPRVPKSAVESYKSMGEPERIALVKAGVSAAKAVLATDTFIRAQDDGIRRQHGAIDHGLTVFTPDELNAQLAAKKITSAAYQRALDRMRSGDAAERAFRDYKDTIRGNLEMNLRSAEYMAKSMPQEKPDPSQRVQLIKAALQLASGDEAAFRRAAAAAFSFDAGGTSDPAEAELLAKEAQQRAYNQYGVKGKLRQGLASFIIEAGKVNFAAATTQKGNRIVFTDVAMERAPAHHKFLYRLGKGPTLAAVTEAKAWLAELK